MRTPLNCLSLALALLFGTASVAWADDITVCSKTVRSNCSEEDDCKSSLIKDDKEWEECTYLVQEHIRVRRGATLTLDPGVTLEFTAPGISLQVGGTLIARGTEGTEETEGKPITFTSGQATPATGDWGGILFSKTAIGASFKKTGETVKYDRGSILEHCVVEFAGWGTSEAAIWAKSPRAPFISQSTIQKNKTSGIRFERNQYARILENTISENGGSGIYINGGRATLSGNTIKGNGLGNNGDGIEFYRGTATLSDNNILENKRRGITVGGTASLSGNTISGNNLSGVSVTGTANIRENQILNNKASINNKASDIGGGILANSTRVTLSHNDIRGNSPRQLWNGNPFGSPNLDARNNCWGTVDEAEIQCWETAEEAQIQEGIWDWNDDLGLGVVTWRPYLTAPVFPSPSPPANPSSTP